LRSQWTSERRVREVHEEHQADRIGQRRGEGSFRPGLKWTKIDFKGKVGYVLSMFVGTGICKK
jgi:hypothetical protein